MKAAIAGAGVFGLTAGIELRRRGWKVTIADPASVPAPNAASTDISKVVRMDYAADELHTALGRTAIGRWIEWNRESGRTLFHQDGFLILSGPAMQPGGFEAESYRLLRSLGEPVEWLGADEIRYRYPVWPEGKYPHGYFNPRDGWAESGNATAWLAEVARREGVEIQEGCTSLPGADVTVLATGAWTPSLLPELGGVMWATAQPVIHYRVENPADWQAPRFPVWAADIGRTGWYGFPALGDGTLKIANHGPGRRMHPDYPREVAAGEHAHFRAFLESVLPALVGAPIASTRVCFYCDTFDGDFWIARHPGRRDLVVAAGDSGHGFKFAPVLGGIIADAVEGVPNPALERFRWREKTAEAREGSRASH